MSLLRNHNYKINVTKVTGPGYTTPEEAFKARSINLEANIIDWNETDLGDIVFDGQYMMGASSLKYKFTKEARTETVLKGDNILQITTDYPSGWVVDKIVDEKGNTVDWLKINKNSGPSNIPTIARLLVEENKTGNNRLGIIHITAGRLLLKVVVEHTNATDVSISIRNSENEAIDIIEFAIQRDQVGTNPEKVPFNISWSPVVANLFFSSTTTGDAFVFSNQTGLDVIPERGSITPADVSVPGSKAYTIAPPAITQADLDKNPFFERSTVYLYSVSDGVESERCC